MKPELVGASSGHAVHMRVVDETVCDRLLLKNRITLQEHQITEKLHNDLRRANFSKVGSSRLEPSSGTPDPHASMMTDHMVEVGKLFSYLDSQVGTKVRNYLTNVCLDMQDVYSDTELELFRLGLLAVALRMERRRVKA
jgi:hypothetical protein